jgi:hypothetical protein
LCVLVSVVAFGICEGQKEDKHRGMTKEWDGWTRGRQGSMTRGSGWSGWRGIEEESGEEGRSRKRWKRRASSGAKE